MKPPLSTLFNATRYRRGVYSATLALSLSVAWPAWGGIPFTDNGNGTVTDASTSLVWDQCPYGLTGAACDTGTVFFGDWPTALTKAVEANAASYKGFTDWRVPNKNELMSIVKLDTYTIGQPSIDTSAFPGTPRDRFWTSTTYASFPSKAWVFSFDDTITGAYSKTNSYYVRLVRSGQSLASFDLLIPPVTTAGPTVSSGPTQSTADVSVTIDVAGTGYWLLVPSAAAAPTPVQVVTGADYGAVTVVGAGNSAMSAATPATFSLSGMTASTAYTLYFVAKNTANNLQAAVSSVAVTTTALVGQTITGFSPASPVVFGAAPVTLSATGGASGQPVVFATTSANSICTVSGTTVTFTGVGVCNLSANQAGGGNYAAATQATASITINAASQTITGFNPASPVVFGAAPVTLSATGGASGQPVLFATTSAGTICTVSGTTVTFTGVGVCNLSANQAGGGNYAAATQATASITINAASQTINGASQTITGFNPASPVVFGAAPATLSATGGASGQPVVFATTSANSICTVSGTTVTFTGVGVCNLSANQAGVGSYAPATQVLASITINAASQTITGFNPASPVVFGAAPVTLSATGGASGQPVVFATTSANSICTVSGTTVTFTGVGVCNLTANQAGAGSYADAPQVSASITVNASRSVSGSSPAGGSITAAFSGGNASCSYASTAFTTASGPPGVTLVHGAFDFTTTNCGAGASLTMTITYPQTLPAGTQVYKYGPTTADASDHWHVLSHPSVSISGNRLTFTVTDNDKDSGDSNPAVGFISDPVGVGVPALGSDATSIPTLSEWGAILLSGLLGLLGLARVRRQNS
ncbi:MAG: DUF1566 domain-containing protein [Comamonadaceae bacterium]|nr:DUF1566 domain-containing protein [Comamonadaceae bacterium]